MKRKNSLAVLSIILAAGLAFAGCSKPDNKETTQAAASESTAGQASENETEEEKAAETESVPAEESSEEGRETEESGSSVEVGSVFSLGSFDGTALSWKAVSVKGGVVFADCESEITVDESIASDPEALAGWFAGDFIDQAFTGEEAADILTVKTVDQAKPELVIWKGEPEDLLKSAEKLAEDDAEAALEVYDLAKIALPESEAPYVGRMNLLKELGRGEEGADEARLLNEAFGGSEAAYSFLVAAAMEKEEYEEAAAAAAEAAEKGFDAVSGEFEQYAADAFEAENYELALLIYGLSGNQEKVDEINSILNPFQGLEVGDVFAFGSYEQDNDAENGAEPVNWIVFAKEGDRLWMVSELGLDSKPFNRTRAEVGWEGSSIRQWLNEDFFAAAFAEDEAKWILPVETEEGVSDSVYLFSTEEAEAFFAAGNTWKLKVSPYAAAQGAEYNDVRKSASWLLRSPGMDESSISYINFRNGEINGNVYVNARRMAVRPVICVGKGTEE